MKSKNASMWCKCSRTKKKAQLSIQLAYKGFPTDGFKV